MTKIDIDDLDAQLIALLSKDARVSNRKIAAELGVTEGTVRGRTKRLQNERLIAFTAITGLEMSQNSHLAFINIQAELSSVRESAAQVAEIPTINAVLVVAGRFNILAMGLFDSIDKLIENTTDEILKIPGVNRVETSISAKAVKYNAKIASLIGQKD